MKILFKEPVVLSFCQVVAVVYVLLLSASASAFPNEEHSHGKKPSLSNYWRDARSGTVLKSPQLTNDQEEKIENLCLSLLKHNSTIPVLKEEFRKLGWELLEIDSEILVLREVSSWKQGGGFYVFRADSTLPILLQAPHSGSDRFTGTIVFKLFREHPVKAAAFNTVSRNLTDLAHHSNTVFLALTRAFARAFPDGRVCQLHGFDGLRLQTDQKKETAIILSNGSRIISGLLITAKECLAGIIDSPLWLFPKDTRQLGGTTNVQGRVLRQNGFKGFLHLELALSLRRELKEKKSLRAAFFKCLFSEVQPVSPSSSAARGQ